MISTEMRHGSARHAAAAESTAWRIDDSKSPYDTPVPVTGSGSFASLLWVTTSSAPCCDAWTDFAGSVLRKGTTRGPPHAAESADRAASSRSLRVRRGAGCFIPPTHEQPLCRRQKPEKTTFRVAKAYREAARTAGLRQNAPARRAECCILPGREKRRLGGSKSAKIMKGRRAATT
jgi:hypothetical protein